MLRSLSHSRLLRLLGRTGATILVTLVGIELVARMSFHSFTGESFDAARLASERGARLAYLGERLGEPPTASWSEETDAGGPTLLRLHPYLGFVGREGAHPWEGLDVSYNAFGMLSTQGYDYPYRKTADELVVGVFGGSVAEGFANLGAEELARVLPERAPKYADRAVVVLPLALGGYKQPQQLFLLQYALLNGFEMDVALNLDGYNEVVLATENAERGVGEVDPSGGHYELLVDLSGSTVDLQVADLLASVATEYRRERSLLQLVDTWPLHRSAFAALVAELWTGASSARNRELNRRLSELALGEATSLADDRPQAPTDDGDAAGPPPEDTGSGLGEGTADAIAEAIALWSRASEMMHAVAAREGLVYVHALQPNQYVEGSKPLTARELQIAYSAENPWSVSAAEGYPMLREEGRAMRERGVPFYDMTQVFSDETGDLYTDACCHFSRRGHELLARAIAEAIAIELERQSAASR